MPFKSVTTAALAALLLVTPALAEITVEDAYARSAGPTAKAGAAFMIIHNSGDADDRLVSATADVSKLVELHTHIDQGNGVMKMTHVEEGFVIPADGMHALQRGGDHVMFMGLNGPWAQGDTLSVTLTFEQAGDVTVEIPVDLERMPGMGMNQDNAMGHGNTGN